LTDNLRLRRHLNDIEEVKEKIKELQKELGGIDPNHLERETRHLQTERGDLLKEVRACQGLCGGWSKRSVDMVEVSSSSWRN
jgi:FtsZ-binding cell division protein ZapB